MENENEKVLFWDYYKRNTLVPELSAENRKSSKMLSVAEAAKYPEGNNWVQGVLHVLRPPKGYSEILSRGISGKYSFYDKAAKKLVESETITEELVANALKNA